MLEEAQAFICKSIEDVDGGAKFRQDHWTRENGDVGVTAVMAGGKVRATPNTYSQTRLCSRSDPHTPDPPPASPISVPPPAALTTPPPPPQVWEKAGCNLAVVRGEMPYDSFRLADDRAKHQGIDRASGYKPGEGPPPPGPEPARDGDERRQDVCEQRRARPAV